MNGSDPYDEVIDRLLAFGPDFEGGLTNHAPMAAEALVSMGMGSLLDEFVEHYVPRLDTTAQVSLDPGPIKSLLDQALPGLVHNAGASAGHGLLRTAHAIRAYERMNTSVRRREVAAAVQYWRDSPLLPTPTELNGTQSLAQVVASLPRLDPDELEVGLLSYAIRTAANRPDVQEIIKSTNVLSEPGDILDQLALIAVEAFLENQGRSAFALLHGVTTSGMARVLLGHLNEESRRTLVASMIGFVCCTFVAFERSHESDENGGHPEHNYDEALLEPQRLAADAAASLDDHSIKFTDSCLSLAARTGERVALVAARAKLNDDPDD